MGFNTGIPFCCVEKEVRQNICPLLLDISILHVLALVGSIGLIDGFHAQTPLGRVETLHVPDVRPFGVADFHRVICYECGYSLNVVFPGVQSIDRWQLLWGRWFQITREKCLGPL